MPHRKREAKPIKNPSDVERYYRTQLRSLVRAIRKEVDREVMPILSETKEEYTADSRPTMDSWIDRIKSALARIIDRFSSDAYESMYENVATTYVRRMDASVTGETVRSVERAVGVDIRPMMSSMSDYIESSIAQNVALIKSIPDQYLKDVQTLVYQGTADGLTPSAIAKRLTEETDVSDRRAKMIARDQSAKITSQITQRRQEDAGIRYYRVSTAGDERVTGRPGGRYPNARISCWGIANKDIGFGKGVYTWKDGATWGGQSGLHPGRHHPQCRCTATPVFDFEVED